MILRLRLRTPMHVYIIASAHYLSMFIARGARQLAHERACRMRRVERRHGCLYAYVERLRRFSRDAMLRRRATCSFDARLTMLISMPAALRSQFALRSERRPVRRARCYAFFFSFISPVEIRYASKAHFAPVCYHVATCSAAIRATPIITARACFTRAARLPLFRHFVSCRCDAYLQLMLLLKLRCLKHIAFRARSLDICWLRSPLLFAMLHTPLLCR